MHKPHPTRLDNLPILPQPPPTLLTASCQNRQPETSYFAQPTYEHSDLPSETYLGTKSERELARTGARNDPIRRGQ